MLTFEVSWHLSHIPVLCFLEVKVVPLADISASCRTSLKLAAYLLHIFQSSHAYAYSSSNTSDYLLPSFRTLSNLFRSVKQQELLRDKIVSNLEFQRQNLSFLQVMSASVGVGMLNKKASSTYVLGCYCLAECLCLKWNVYPCFEEGTSNKTRAMCWKTDLSGRLSHHILLR